LISRVQRLFAQLLSFTKTELDGSAGTTPLTNEEKRARVEAELKADPARSDNAVAKTVGVAQDFVGRIRARLETQGVISNITPSERKSAPGKVGEGQKGQPVKQVLEPPVL
jgi:transposase